MHIGSVQQKQILKNIIKIFDTITRMKRIVFFVLLIGISTTLLIAQNRSQQGRGRVTLSGTVLDKEDDSPIVQATVQLLSLPDSTMAVGNVTNNNGRFSLSVRPGKYVLKVSYVGYLNYMKEYQLTASKPTVNDAGTLVFGCSVSQLVFVEHALTEQQLTEVHFHVTNHKCDQACALTIETFPSKPRMRTSVPSTTVPIL